MIGDGTKKRFNFDNGMIISNNGKWHEITSYGDLTEISKRLRDSVNIE